jgi:hypothetical protein
LRLLAHVLAAGREPDHRSRHGDAGDGDGAHEFDAVERARIYRTLVGERGEASVVSDMIEV